jgi:hypothetical protein
MFRLFFNPLYLLVPPALILASIPLVFFAFLTSTIAFTTLLIRVSIVYFELTLALIRSALFTEPSKPAKQSHTRHHVPSNTPRRRGSVISNSSSQDFAHPRKYGPIKSESFASLVGTGGPRDYEGIGGWRDPGEDPAEEALWIGMNSRLELPAIAPTRQRNHQRSLTGGSQRWSGVWSPETMRMSPVQSRARTPSFTENGDEYFGLQLHGRSHPENQSSKRRKSLAGSVVGVDKKKNAGNGDDRRKSSSGSSISSLNSSGKLSRSAVKQTSHG